MSYQPDPFGHRGPLDTPDFSANLRVGDAERDQTVSLLQAAYAEGRLDRVDFDHRLDQAFAAVTRADLDAVCQGLAAPRAFGTPAARLRQYSADPCGAASIGAGGGGTDLRGALVHWASIPVPLLAPAAAYVVTPKRSRVKREAAKALNFNVTFFPLIMVLGVVGTVIHQVNPITGLVTLVWFFGNLIAGLQAYRGKDWTNPVSRLVQLKIVDPDKQRRSIGR